MAPADVPPASTPLYDDGTLRTLFLTFEQSDWEAELAAFYNTDVEVPATLIVDGKTYSDVGVHFRGASSYFMVPSGYKRSLNLAIDFVDQDQALLGYRTLNLNNANGDPSLMRAVIYEHIARQYVPTPAANFVRVVINGEYWGVFTNVAQFNKDFLRDHFKTDEGARWKVPGRPNGRGGLEYLSDDVEAYRRLYEIKTKDNDASWQALIALTRVLNTTPPDQLEAVLAPHLDIDGALKFLALENVLVNSDGYWTRASDFSLHLDPGGRFHLVPHDINEAMMTAGPGGRGGRGGRGVGGPGGPGGGGGVELDPLVGLEDASKPLRSKLLAVPALRERYLGYVQDIATRWLDWSTLGPIVTEYRDLIAADVARDTKKVSSTDDFTRSVEGLKAFADARRGFLLKTQRN
jgi:spore coat protein CotH